MKNNINDGGEPDHHTVEINEVDVQVGPFEDAKEQIEFDYVPETERKLNKTRRPQPISVESQSSDATVSSEIPQKKDSSIQRILKSVDIYGQPIRLHHNGKVNQTSKTGGGFSIISILFLLILVGNIAFNSVKDVNRYIENLEEEHSQQRHLQEEPVAAETNEEPTTPEKEEVTEEIEQPVDTSDEIAAPKEDTRTELDQTEEGEEAPEEGDAKDEAATTDGQVEGEDNGNSTQTEEQPDEPSVPEAKNYTGEINTPDSLNFKFKSEMFEEITVDQRNVSYKASENGISKIEIVFNQASLLENIDEDINNKYAYSAQGTEYAKKYDNGPYWQVRRNASSTEQKKGHLTLNLPYIKFEIDIRTFQAMGSGSESIQIEGGELSSESYQEKITLTLDDLDWETDPLMPRFEISEHVKVLGDMFANSSGTQNRTITTMRIYADYESMYQDAFAETNQYMWNIKKDALRDGTYYFAARECTQDQIDAQAAKYGRPKLSEADILQLKDDGEFAKQKQLKAFTAKHRKINRQFMIDYQKLAAKIDKENAQNLKQALYDDANPAPIVKNKELSPEFLAAYTARASDCNAGFEWYKGSKTKPTDTSLLKHMNFESTFPQTMKGKLDALSDNLRGSAGHLFADSIQIRMTKNDTEAQPQVLSQDVSFKSNFDCFYAATYTSSVSGAEEICTKSQNLIYFQLQQNYIQDVVTLRQRSIEAKEMTLNSTRLNFKRKLGLKRYQSVLLEKAAKEPMMDYETIWSVSFALDNSVLKTKEIWLIQDPNERKNQTRLLQEQVPTFESKNAELIYKYILLKVIDSFALIGAVWFFITKMFIGPVAEMANSSDHIAADLGKREFVKKSNDNTVPVEVVQNKLVK